MCHLECATWNVSLGTCHLECVTWNVSLVNSILWRGNMLTTDIRCQHVYPVASVIGELCKDILHRKHWRDGNNMQFFVTWTGTNELSSTWSYVTLVCNITMKARFYRVLFLKGSNCVVRKHNTAWNLILVSIALHSVEPHSNLQNGLII